MKRPSVINLLISMRQNFLHPQPVKTIDRVVLYDGPLGQVFGGSDPDLMFTPHVVSYPLSMSVHPTNTINSITMRATVKEATYTTLAKSERELPVTCVASRGEMNDDKLMDIVGNNEDRTVEDMTDEHNFFEKVPGYQI